MHDDAVRVLLVDDDPLVRTIMSAKLLEQGYRVTQATDGLAALDMLGNAPADIVVTDLEMPDLDGFGLIRRIRGSAWGSALPIVVVTGSDDTKACEQAFEAGATAFITKPVNWVLLSQQIGYVLRNAERESALRAARREAEKATAFKDNLLAVIGHELKTPLNSIIGFSKMLTDELHGPLGASEYMSYSNEILASGSHLNTMISNALLASHLFSGDRKADRDLCSVDEILKSLRTRFASAHALADVRLEMTTSDVDLDVYCDSALAQSALGHLLSNAVRHAPSSSVIRVSVEKTSTATVFAVEDEGPGIDDERARELTAPFVQGDVGLGRNSVGLGLGLTLVNVIADLHGGSLYLENREAGGLKAILEFPPRKTINEKALEQAA